MFFPWTASSASSLSDSANQIGVNCRHNSTIVDDAKNNSIEKYRGDPFQLTGYEGWPLYIRESENALNILNRIRPANFSTEIFPYPIFGIHSDRVI